MTVERERDVKQVVASAATSNVERQRDVKQVAATTATSNVERERDVKQVAATAATSNVERERDVKQVAATAATSILDLFKLTDRVAIVTGAGKGIGRGIALAFAEAGADVVCAARTAADVEATAAAVRERGRRALAVPTDVMKTEALEALVATTMAELGRIDVLVNNAGGTLPRPALQTSERYFEAALRFNVTSAFLLTRLVVPRMVESAGGGAIVNISSRASDMVQTSFVAYAAGKAALNMVTRNLAAEFAPKVRVNAISVGGIATDALQVVLTNDELRRQFEENTPMGRAGTVEDIAACALYLASPAGGWVTGKIFQVDGGTEHPSISVPVPKL